MVTEWFCKKKGVRIPDVLGYEVDDADSGNWSFLLFYHGFTWWRHVTWANHFATAEHTGMLLKAVSESRHLSAPVLTDFLVRGVVERHMQELGLLFQPESAVDKYGIRIRLPDVPGSSVYPRRPVHWIGPCTLDPAIRS